MPNNETIKSVVMALNNELKLLEEIIDDLKKTKNLTLANYYIGKANELEHVIKIIEDAIRYDEYICIGDSKYE